VALIAPTKLVATNTINPTIPSQDSAELLNPPIASASPNTNKPTIRPMKVALSSRCGPFESTGLVTLYTHRHAFSHISRSTAWSFGDRRLACDPHVSSGALNDVLPRASFIREDLTGLGRDTLQGWRTVAGMTVR